MQEMIKSAYETLLAKEYDKAFELYTALEKQKEPVSYYYLGFLYFRGYGVKQNTQKAFDYYLEAATREVPVAQFEVALMLENGEGCEKNEVIRCGRQRWQRTQDGASDARVSFQGEGEAVDGLYAPARHAD